MAAVGFGRAIGLERNQLAKIWVIGNGRVAQHTVVVLYAAFGGQAVIIPTQRIEDILTAHTLVAGDNVGLSVGEHVPHMERAGCGRRWGINRIDLFARRVLVEGVGFLLCPALGELLLETFKCGTIRNVNLCGRV